MTIRVQDVIRHRPDKKGNGWARVLTICSDDLPPTDTEYEVVFHKTGQILLNPITPPDNGT